MPHIRVWIHFVWSTKDRYPYMSDKAIRTKIFDHIRENAKKKDIYIDFIGGYSDHIHALISLGSSQSMDAIMQLLKGESSHWINKNRLFKARFEWQDEYFAASVSESMLDKVRDYIANQEEHHKTQTFEQEYEKFLKKAGFSKYKA